MTKKITAVSLFLLVLLLGISGSFALESSYNGVRLDTQKGSNDPNGRYAAINYAIKASLTLKNEDMSDVNINSDDIDQYFTEKGHGEDVITSVKQGIDEQGYVDQYLINAYLASADTGVSVNYMQRIPVAQNQHAKIAVKSFGGMLISYNYNSIGVKGNNCFTNESYGNRKAVIIGWDDEYSDFKTKPSNKGAWIIKDDVFDGGFGYISYYDNSISEYGITLDCSVNTFDKVYQYDGGYTHDKDLFFGYTGYMANVFECEHDQYLEQVGFYINGNEHVEYEVRVYMEPADDKNPASGFFVNNQKEMRVTGVVEKPGYYTAKLKEPIVITKEDKFSVVIILKSKNQNVYLPVDTDGEIKSLQGETILNCEPVSSFKQSYVSMDGIDWEDIGGVGNANVRIKAYTTNIYTPSGNKKLIVSLLIVSVLWICYIVYKIKACRKKA